jgi:hypothetical protein
MKVETNAGDGCDILILVMICFSGTIEVKRFSIGRREGTTTGEAKNTTLLQARASSIGKLFGKLRAAAYNQVVMNFY